MRKIKREVCNLNFRADLLRELIRKHKLSQHKIAEIIGVTDKCFSSKMNGVTEWKLSEIQQLQKILDGLDVIKVFNIKKI